MISSVTDLRATLGDVFDLEVGAEDAERLFIAMRRFADNANPALRVEG
jgi:hypothetical protein